ncbi:ATP-binding protein [Neobacillus cucumis]|uniref:sensor histidine kinase n=1 Tax=Neobacillus cucumis TaxID=1740721 RepID=UPI00203E9F5E|nr:ATP-binding protein [Neobacillus cucumis]MCM3726482.1 ATP-binding protein [Neobacillus cucumis]
MNRLKINQLIKSNLFVFIFILVAVPLAGELKFYPFHDTFRVSLGTPIFFFSLLLLRGISPILLGICTALSILSFRVGLDWLTQDHFDLLASVQTRYPSSLYYFMFVLLFYLLKLNQFHSRPWIIGVLGITIEIISSLTELMFQHVVDGNYLSLSILTQIFIIAIFRSFFVLSFFSMMKLYEGKIRERQIRQKNHYLLMLLSNLYVESVQLKKVLKNAENITITSYDLYRDINEYMKQTGLSLESFSNRALRIAGEVHDIKKDNQRIFAGLFRLIEDEKFSDYMDIQELVPAMIRTNEQYASSLGKKIEFRYQIDGEHPEYHAYLVLSLINNLVANAVEAIEEKGTIAIYVKLENQFVWFQVEDDGPGVSEKDKSFIFKPGFTLKFDHAGTPSTGIGLSYVQEITEELGGCVDLQNGSKNAGAIFTIKLPINSLVERG